MIICVFFLTKYEKDWWFADSFPFLVTPQVLVKNKRIKRLLHWIYFTGWEAISCQDLAAPSENDVKLGSMIVNFCLEDTQHFPDIRIIKSGKFNNMSTPNLQNLGMSQVELSMNSWTLEHWSLSENRIPHSLPHSIHWFYHHPY